MVKQRHTILSIVLLLLGCSAVPQSPEGKQPFLNGLAVKEIYYDDIEDPVGYGKYHAFLFLLSGNKFVIWRNNDKAEYILSNFEILESKYPSTKDPVKFTMEGNNISGLSTYNHMNDEMFKPHIYYNKYEGKFVDSVLHLKRSSWYEFQDGAVENSSAVIWNFRKVREYP